MPLLGSLVGWHRPGQSGQWAPRRWALSCDLELVGSPHKNNLAIPDWEVRDVGAAPGEKHGVDLTGGSETQLLGVTDGIHHILVSKLHRCLNTPPQPPHLVPGWHKVLI